MHRYRASWLLPIIGQPLKYGWVYVDNGLIVSVGCTDQEVPGPGKPLNHRDGLKQIDLGSVVVMPGLVNAHTHLELSALAGEVPSASAMPHWVEDLLARRIELKPDGDASIREAIKQLRQSGTVLVGDVSNTLASVKPLVESQLAAVVFREIIGFRSADAVKLVEQACRELMTLVTTHRVRTSLAAHAPYSVSSKVCEMIRSTVDRWPGAPRSIHLAESVEEVDFLQTGSGPWKDLLIRLGAWDSEWTPPGYSPTDFLRGVGWLDDRAIVVHGVQLKSEDLCTLGEAGVTLVACPRSNEWTGAGQSPVASFYEAGVRVAIGTDSLASTADLNLFTESAAVRRLAPDVAGRTILESATRQGARALGFGDDYGSIEPGKRADLIAVQLPDIVEDVEEYLLSGIQPQQVLWIRDQQ